MYPMFSRLIQSKSHSRDYHMVSEFANGNTTCSCIWHRTSKKDCAHITKFKSYIKKHVETYKREVHQS